jgi:hypothetical protein
VTPKIVLCLSIFPVSSASVSLLHEHVAGSRNHWLSLPIIVDPIKAILTLFLYDLYIFNVFLEQYLNVSNHSIHSKQQRFVIIKMIGIKTINAVLNF